MRQGEGKGLFVEILPMCHATVAPACRTPHVGSGDAARDRAPWSAGRTAATLPCGHGTGRGPSGRLRRPPAGQHPRGLRGRGRARRRLGRARRAPHRRRRPGRAPRRRAARRPRHRRAPRPPSSRGGSRCSTPPSRPVAGMGVNVEIKADCPPETHDGLVAAVVEAAARTPASPERFLVTSFAWPLVDRVRALAPELPTGLLAFDLAAGPDPVDRGRGRRAPGREPVGPASSTRPSSARAHAAGLRGQHLDRRRPRADRRPRRPRRRRRDHQRARCGPDGARGRRVDVSGG